MNFEPYFEPLARPAVVARKICANQITTSVASVTSLVVGNIASNSATEPVTVQQNFKVLGTAAVRRLQVGASNVTPTAADIWGQLNVKSPAMGPEANIVLDGELQAGSIRATKVSATGTITAANLMSVGAVLSTDLQTRIDGNPATGRVSFTTTNTALGALTIDESAFVDLRFSTPLPSNNYTVSLTSVVTTAGENTPTWGVSNISTNGFVVNSTSQRLIAAPFGFSYQVSRWA